MFLLLIEYKHLKLYHTLYGSRYLIVPAMLSWCRLHGLVRTENHFLSLRFETLSYVYDLILHLIHVVLASRGYRYDLLTTFEFLI